MNVAVASSEVRRAARRDWQTTGLLRMKVAAQTPVSRLAGAVARAMREGREVELVAIGVAATYNAVKGLAVAREYLMDDAIGVRAEVCWVLVSDWGPGEERTALAFRLAGVPGGPGDVER